MPEITNPFAWMWILFIASILFINIYFCMNSSKRNFSQVVKLAYDIFKTFKGLISREDALKQARLSQKFAQNIIYNQ